VLFAAREDSGGVWRSGKDLISHRDHRATESFSFAAIAIIEKGHLIGDIYKLKSLLLLNKLFQKD